MGRLKEDLVARAEGFSDRMLDVVEALEQKRVYSRVISQMVGCGTSVGANTFEADQAVSAPDFCKALGIAVKELGECRYWLRTCARRGWLPETRLAGLEDEATQLGRIYSVMIVRSRRTPVRAS
jgi:four helix bundle protein